MVIVNRGPESGKALLGRRVLIVVRLNASVFIMLIKLVLNRTKSMILAKLSSKHWSFPNCWLYPTLFYPQIHIVRTSERCRIRTSVTSRVRARLETHTIWDLRRTQQAQAQALGAAAKFPVSTISRQNDCSHGVYLFSTRFFVGTEVGDLW